MSQLLGQFTYPVFLHQLWVFLLFGSALGFVVGFGLALRIGAMLRFFDKMNRWVSIRQWMKPLSVPHFIEPVLMKRPILLGMTIIPGAATAVVLLKDLPAEIFNPVFLGATSYGSAVILSEYTKLFLLVGNLFCIVVGVLLLVAPGVISRLEGYTDMWYSVRQKTQGLSSMRSDVDQWVLAHPTVSGLTLMVLSAGLGLSMFARL